MYLFLGTGLELEDRTWTAWILAQPATSSVPFSRCDSARMLMSATKGTPASRSRLPTILDTPCNGTST